MEEELKNFRKVLKVKEDEIMVLPWGNAKKEDVIKYITSLSDKKFSLLLQNPIGNQARIFYSNLRKENND